MATTKWELSEVDGRQVYLRGGFTIRHEPAAREVIGARPFWRAFLNGEEVKRDRDLKVVMDYCEELEEKLA